jgi:hypothetical protein
MARKTEEDIKLQTFTEEKISIRREILPNMR